MKITSCKGKWLEKTIKTSPEDSFVRSTVIYKDDKGKEKEFHLLYIGFFEKAVLEASPYEEDVAFDVNGNNVYFRDLTALIALLQNPSYQNQRRVYVYDQEQFNSLFDNVDYSKVEDVAKEIITKGHYNIDQSTPYLNKSAS